MTKEQAEDILYEAGELGYELEVQADYSGRGMMGKVTYAVVGFDEEIREAVANSEICYEVKFRTDSMGKNQVVYY